MKRQLIVPVVFERNQNHLFQFHHVGMLMIQQLIQYLSQVSDDTSACNERDMSKMKSYIKWQQDDCEWRIWYNIRHDTQDVLLELEPETEDTTRPTTVGEKIIQSIDQYLKIVFPFHKFIVEYENTKPKVSPDLLPSS